MTQFDYTPMFPLGRDDTDYRLLSKDHVKVESFNGRDVLVVDRAALELVAEKAFKDVAHLYGRATLKN